MPKAAYITISQSPNLESHCGDLGSWIPFSLHLPVLITLTSSIMYSHLLQALVLAALSGLSFPLALPQNPDPANPIPTNTTDPIYPAYTYTPSVDADYHPIGQYEERSFIFLKFESNQRTEVFLFRTRIRPFNHNPRRIQLPSPQRTQRCIPTLSSRRHHALLLCPPIPELSGMRV